MPKLALTISHKLIGLIVGLMIAVVGLLALYLSSMQIEAMTVALRTKATTYGSVMSSQAASAVAFSDRETAREVLHSIDVDADVASVMLYGPGGVVLYSRGESLAGISGTTVVAAPRVLDAADRITAAVPVVSLEGPRGVLVIELSTASLQAARHHVRWLAFLTGGLALAGGSVAAWLIARRLARRLRAIADVASAVAGGDLTQQPINDPQRDEIGTLAAAFNAMLAQIKQLLADVQDMARKEQDRLESLVAQRTAQLDLRNAEMRLVLDQVDQGLVMVDLDGTLATERSAAVERLLGPAPAAGTLHDYVRGFAPDAAAWFAVQWNELREGVMPPELCIEQLPARFEIEGRHVELAYKLTEAAGVPRVLVVITDVTAQVLRQRDERDERETGALLSRMLSCRAAFLAFHAEATHCVAVLAAGARDDDSYRRTVHTLKGITALEGIESVAELCHALENALADGDELLARTRAREICARWELVTAKLAPLISAASGRLELVPADLEVLELALRRGEPSGQLLAIVDSWRHERVSQRLERSAEGAQVLAQRLGKGPIAVDVDVAHDLRLPSERWGPFWAAMVHAIRNAIDHGVESPEERLASGKAPTPRLTLRARRSGSETVVEIEDDGRGIDWAKVAQRAAALGLPTDTEAHLIDALFRDGLSTRDAASEISGRGIGMAALREACLETGGRITVTSRRGLGTTLAFHWSNTPTRHELLQIAG